MHVEYLLSFIMYGNYGLFNTGEKNQQKAKLWKVLYFY